MLSITTYARNIVLLKEVDKERVKTAQAGSFVSKLITRTSQVKHQTLARQLRSNFNRVL